MDLDEELDFEELDEDFGNVDSLLYESIDGKNEQNIETNDESEQESIDENSSQNDRPVVEKVDQQSSDSNADSSDARSDERSGSPEESTQLKTIESNKKTTNKDVVEDSNSQSNSWSTSSSSKSPELPEPTKVFDNLENFLEAFDKSPNTESKNTQKVKPKHTTTQSIMASNKIDNVSEKGQNISINQNKFVSNEPKQSSKPIANKKPINSENQSSKQTPVRPNTEIPVRPNTQLPVRPNKSVESEKKKSVVNESSNKKSDNSIKSLSKETVVSNKSKSQPLVESIKSKEKTFKKSENSCKPMNKSSVESNKSIDKSLSVSVPKSSVPSVNLTQPSKTSSNTLFNSVSSKQSTKPSAPTNANKVSFPYKPSVPITKPSSVNKPNLSMPSISDFQENVSSDRHSSGKRTETQSKPISPTKTSVVKESSPEATPEPVPEIERISPIEPIVHTPKAPPLKQNTPLQSSSKSRDKPVVLESVKPSIPSTIASNLLNTSLSVGISSTPPASQPLKKTEELDLKFYNAIRNYLTKRIIFGYHEETFKEDVKRFKLHKNGKTLLHNGKEVIETDEQQRKLAIDYHLNAMARHPNQRHRGFTTTAKALRNKYFWPSIDFDVKNVLNQCRVCNTKEYDLMSAQKWKFIEIGVIEDVLIVRDINEKSEIFICEVLDPLSPENLSKYLMSLFAVNGTPNAIRIVLPKNFQKDFTESFREFLRKDLYKLIEEMKHSIELPMVDIKTEFGDDICPKNEDELELNFAIVEEEDSVSLFYIFSCNNWLINSFVFNCISKEIKDFIQRHEDWKTRIWSLTNIFRIKQIHLKANEEDGESKIETRTPKNKRIANWKEVENLHSDLKTAKPSKSKREIKTPELSDTDDDMISTTSSKYSNTSTVKSRNGSESKLTKEKEKKLPFKVAQRAEIAKKASTETIDIDDSSNLSSFSQTLSTNSGSNSQTTETPVSQSISSQIIENSTKNYDPNGICRPCFVLIDNFSQHYIENAIKGKIKWEDLKITEKNRNETKNHETFTKSQNDELMVSEDSEPEVEEVVHSLVASNETKQNKTEVSNKVLSIESIISKELKTRNESPVSLDLNLSENTSQESQKLNVSISKPKSSSSEESKRMSTLGAQPKRTKTPTKSQTPVTPRTQPKRKTSRNTSDKESDSDIKDNDISDSHSRKRLKTDLKVKSNNNNSKSLPNRQTKRISKRLVISESSDSNESDDNKSSDDVKSGLNSNSRKVDENKTTSKTIEVFECQFCDFKTNDKRQLLLHSAGKHGKDRNNKIYCDICTQAFFSRDVLNRHKEEEHPPEMRNTVLYGCEVCKGFECQTIEELDQHLQSTHIESLAYMKTTNSKFRCTVCKVFTAGTEQLISTHLSQKHLSFKCAFDCSQVAPNFQTLERHAKSSHSRYGKPFECKYCDFNSAVFGCLVQHKQQSHAIDWTSDQRNKCCLCEQTFDYDDWSNILDHMISHCMEFSYFECKLCQKRCKKFDQIKYHVITHHAIGPDDCIKYIENLNELFNDLLNRVKERDNQLKRQSAPNETQNAIAGLMGEEFVFEDSGSVDPLATALQMTFNGDEDNDNPTISIPEENGEEVGYISMDSEGQWFPET